MMQTFEKKQQALQAAIENLYVAFSSYKLRAPVEGCDCCVKKDDKKRLAAKPLRQLQEDDLSRYAFKAMTTWGDEYDFKHFLPRILELLATGCSLTFGADILPNKLGYAEWRTWPDNENKAIHSFLLALWDFDLSGGRTGDSTESWMSGISQIVSDVTPFLQLWEDSNSLEAAQSLLDFVPFYYAHHSQIDKWLASDALLQRFEQRFTNSANDAGTDIYAQIVDALTNFRYIAKVRETNETPNPD